MTNFLIKWAVSAISLAVAAKLIKGINIDSGWTLLVAALVIGLLNATLRWFLIILTLPINILTLGLFTFVINAVMIILASKLVDGFQVVDFWTAFLAAILMSIVGFFLNILFDS
ncbi:MAG TPA: phage holin family protein [Desulfomonilia bacterium]